MNFKYFSKNIASTPQAGFTLVEVGFALGIMVSVVVTVMLLIASSQRSQ